MVFSVDIDSELASELDTNCCCLPTLVGGPFIRCCDLGDIRPGDVRLLTTELVGDTEFDIELFRVDVVVERLLFVMEVNIA